MSHSDAATMGKTDAANSRTGTPRLLVYVPRSECERSNSRKCFGGSQPANLCTVSNNDGHMPAFSPPMVLKSGTEELVAANDVK